MSAKKYSLVIGIVMLAIGLVALVPALQGSALGLPALNLEASYGLFLGLIPMNILNKILLIGMGAAGIWVYYNAASAVLYARWVFAITLVGALMGLFPVTNTFFGYAPLFGSAVVVHALIAAVSAYFGFAATRWTSKPGYSREASA